MSSGPIAMERMTWKPAEISTPGGCRVCMRAKDRGYCGRTSAKRLVADWAKVVCADCRAAARADGVDVPAEVPVCEIEGHDHD